MQKTVYILRHAKAEAAASDQDDHERQLAPSGIRAAGQMGKYLAFHGVVPDKVLCSTAARTVETLEHIFPPPVGGGSKRVEYLDALYLASGNEILNLLSRLPDNIESVMVVAHNPGLHQLAVRLARTGHGPSLQALSFRFPTCAFVEIRFDDIVWRMILRARGRLERFVTPKDLE